VLYLSKRGRITLIKSTLSNLLTYFMSLFPLPTRVARHNEKLQQDFLWGGMGQRVQISPGKLAQGVFFDSIRGEGALGVRNLLMFNRALLGK
jgi:hypothetical protein